MNIAALRYFVKVAQSKSISRAAEEAFITQPALSRHLQRLETELGVVLFTRSRGKMTCELTEAGKACLHDAESIIAHADNMISVAQMLGRGEQGVLTIGLGGLEAEWLFELIRQIRVVYPRIELRPVQMNWNELGEGIADRSIDLAIFQSGFHYPEDACFRYVPLAKSRLQVIVSKGHRFSERKSITVDELNGERFIRYGKEITPGYYESFDKLCQKHGFSPNFVREYKNSRMIWSDIYSDFGIGLYESCAQKLDNKMFSQVEVLMDEDDPWPSSEISIVYHRDNDAACLKSVISLIPDIAQRLEF